SFKSWNRSRRTSAEHADRCGLDRPRREGSASSYRGAGSDRRAPPVIGAGVLPHQYSKSHANRAFGSSRVRHLRRGGAGDRLDAGWILAWRWLRSHRPQGGFCAKVVDKTLWGLDEVGRHWDQLILRAYVTIGGRRLKYQEGLLSAMRNSSDLMSRAGDAAKFATGTIMFCGTLGAIGDVRPAGQFMTLLEDPILGREMSCEYDVDVLRVVS